MLDVNHLLRPTLFPSLNRAALDILQVNLGFKCNLSCIHCHVNAGPKRTEEMDRETIDEVLSFLRKQKISLLDLTGGAPELNPNFRYLIEQAVADGVRVIDRCNLTILELPEQAGLAEFLAENRVEVVASMPCYLQENVDTQRGKGTFDESIKGLRRLNALGYGEPDSGLILDLVFNPQGASLPPPQCGLEADYKKHLGGEYGIKFNQLLTITNMPIQRFGSLLLSKGEFDDYLSLLKSSYKAENLASVMCRNLLSVDWRGYVYDCDFNQQLDMPLMDAGDNRQHLSELAEYDFANRPIQVGEHCYGCTAGQGSSCGGALEE